MLNRTIDLDKISCPQQLAKDFSADTIKDELRSLGIKCGGTISESIDYGQPKTSEQYLRYLSRQMLASTQSESKKKHKPKIVDNDDVTQ